MRHAVLQTTGPFFVARNEAILEALRFANIQGDPLVAIPSSKDIVTRYIIPLRIVDGVLIVRVLKPVERCPEHAISHLGRLLFLREA